MLKDLIQFMLCFPLLAVFAQSVSAQTKNIDLQGHRGCRGLMPENTIAAILHSIDLGVTTLEMDVVVTRDNKVILSHETFMNPEISTPPMGKQFSSPKDKSYNIFQMTYEEVSKWDVGMKIHPKFPTQKKMPAIKPLLSDVIAAVEEYVKANHLKPLNYNIETKCAPSTDGISHPAPEAFVALLVDVITKGNVSNRTTIQSFDKRSLQVLHQTHPSIKSSYLIEPGRLMKKKTLKKWLHWVSMASFRIILTGLVSLKTVNSPLIHQLSCLFGNFTVYLKQCKQLK